MENEKKAPPKRQLSVKKKYSPPVLSLYGKLTEITAGGSTGDTEQQPVQKFKQKP